LVVRGEDVLSDPTCANSVKSSTGYCIPVACDPGPWILTQDLVATSIGSPPASAVGRAAPPRKVELCVLTRTVCVRSHGPHGRGSYRASPDGQYPARRPQVELDEVESTRGEGAFESRAQQVARVQAGRVDRDAGQERVPPQAGEAVDLVGDGVQVAADLG
jgi:hypothetical protein